MSKKIIEIPVNELLDSLKLGYEEYKKCLEDEHDLEDLSHVKGFCTTLEQMLAIYGDVTKVEMMNIKKPILGNISLKRKAPKVNYDIPTFIRKQKD
jgi:hypothetical protein